VLGELVYTDLEPTQEGITYINCVSCILLFLFSPNLDHHRNFQDI